MIPVDFSWALMLYLFAYLGLVLGCWCRYEWKRSHEAKGTTEKKATEDSSHGHVDRA
jgi:hypothetical protein